MEREDELEGRVARYFGEHQLPLDSQDRGCHFHHYADRHPGLAHSPVATAY